MLAYVTPPSTLNLEYSDCKDPGSVTSKNSDVIFLPPKITDSIVRDDLPEEGSH